MFCMPVLTVSVFLFQDVNFLIALSILCIMPGMFEFMFNSSIFILGLCLTYANIVSL